MSLPRFDIRIAAATLTLSITAVLGFVAPPAFAATNVSGTLTGNQTWTKAESPYHLTGFTTLVEGATLTVEPGVTVESDLYGISIRGVLIAVGTAADPIDFDLKEGIELRTGSLGTRIAWATLRGSWTALRNRYVGEQAPAPTELHQVEFRENISALDLWAPNSASTSYSDLRFMGNERAIDIHTAGDFDLTRVLIEETEDVAIKLNQVHGPSFVIRQSNLAPPENGSCNTTETGCSAALADGTISTPVVEFNNVYWGATDVGVIESRILDGNDFPGSGYPVLDRIDDAKHSHDLYPPVSSPSLPEGSATSSLTSVEGTASDGQTASSGIQHVTASLLDLNTGEWWDGNDWGTTEEFLPTTGTTSWTLDTLPLISGHKYQVRSMAVDGSGLDQFGAGSSYFLVDTTPPDAFDLLSPPDGTVTDTTPSLSWTESNDSGSGLFHYKVYIDNSEVAKTPPGTESYVPSELTPGAHTWSVQAIDGAGNIRESEVRSFTIDTTPPDAFDLLSPPNGAVTNATPLLSWSPSADAVSGLDRYEVYIDGAKVTETSPGTESFETTTLAPGAHTWFVQAVDTLENSRESETRSLIVASPPAALLSASPSPALTGTAVAFSAAASTPPPGGSITGFEWDFDGNGSYDQSTSTATTAHSYSSPGDFTVAVRVSSNLGTSSIATAPLSIRRAPPPGPLGVSINDGAQFTNDPKVDISTVWPAFALTALVSNDGGFKAAQSFPVASTIPWTLDSSGPERLPKTIYVRFQGGGAGAETYQDDIILDETDPEVMEASFGGGASASTATVSKAWESKKRTSRLRIRAKDNVSGVLSMQIKLNRGKPRRWQPFKSSIGLAGRPKRISVRVLDRAGNASKWRRAKLGRRKSK